MSRAMLFVASIISILLVSATPGAFGQPAAPVVVTADLIQWKPVSASAPLPPGTMIGTLAGDPTKAGSEFSYRLKFEDGAKGPPHHHNVAEQLTVIQGTLLVGFGSTFDTSKMQTVGPGGYVAIPADTPHYVMAKGTTIIQVNATGVRTNTLEKM